MSTPNPTMPSAFTPNSAFSSTVAPAATTPVSTLTSSKPSRSVNFVKDEITGTRTFSPVVFEKFSEPLPGSKKRTAQVRQTVTTVSKYPGARGGNSLNDALFAMADFGTGNEYTSTSNRVAWIEVPDGTTAQEVQNRLDQLPEATIYSITQTSPIYSDTDIWALQNNRRTQDQYADSQVMRYGPNPSTVGAKPGSLILDEGHFLYKRHFFSAVHKDDIRNLDFNRVYGSPALVAERDAQLAAEKAKATIQQGTANAIPTFSM